MRRVIYFSCLFSIAAAFLMGCAGMHMITMKNKPEIVANPDHAVLVIMGTKSYNSQKIFNLYLDKQMIGQTAGRDYFITKVSPGEHYIIAKIFNSAVFSVATGSAVKLKFDAGKIYLLEQSVSTNGLLSETFSSFLAINPEYALNSINSGFKYKVYDQNRPGENLSEGHFGRAKGGFDNAARSNPEKYSVFVNYTGYSSLK